jgi:hypothetical protein
MMKARDEKSLKQKRTVSIGSNFPDEPGHPPKLSVYVI